MDSGFNYFTEDWYGEEEIEYLIEQVNKVKHLQGAVIEIGCWEGRSTHNLANEIYPEILICNDTWLGNVEESKVLGFKHDTIQILERRDVYKKFIDNMNYLTRKNYTVVKEDCNIWLQHFNEPIKFCHIDACHDYDSVARTINLVLPKMVKGGIICGDDFQSAHINRHDLNGGVERAVRELLPGFENHKDIWYWINH